MQNAKSIFSMALATCWLAFMAPVQAAEPEQSHSATLYRLNSDASYTETCFAPCDCPPPASIDAVRGTFYLSYAVPGNVVDFRYVSKLHWTTHSAGAVVHRLSGDGVYKVTNFAPDRDQSLELRLSIDGTPPQYFFSDFVSVGQNAPNIDVTVSLNGFYCHDTVMRVSATPVPQSEIVPYKLLQGSTYRQGCFDPCDCILEDRRPMAGRFALVPLVNVGTYAEYAILGPRFIVPGIAANQASLQLSGNGRYSVIQGFAGPIQSMALSLKLNGAGPLRFNQEPHNANVSLPAMDISVDVNDQVCFDRVLTIVAEPMR